MPRPTPAPFSPDSGPPGAAASDADAALRRLLAEAGRVAMERWQQAATARAGQDSKRLAGLETVSWLSYHHPWGYLTDALGLAEPLVVSQQLDAGPGSRRFVELADQVQRREVRCAIREPEARVALMTRLCPDCRVQPLDPLGRDYPDLDYLTWRDRLVAGFKACLQPEAG